MGHQADTPDNSTVPKYTRLLRRGSRYYLRAKVPIDLRAAMGKKEIKWSLDTSDPSEALQRIKFESAKADRIFDEARRTKEQQNRAHRAKENGQSSHPLRILSAEHIHDLARTWLIDLEKAQKDWWEKEGRSLDSQATIEVLVDLSHERIAITGEEPDAQILINDGQREVAQFLKAHGYPFKQLAQFLWATLFAHVVNPWVATLTRRPAIGARSGQWRLGNAFGNQLLQWRGRKD